MKCSNFVKFVDKFDTKKSMSLSIFHKFQQMGLKIKVRLCRIQKQLHTNDPCYHFQVTLD